MRHWAVAFILILSSLCPLGINTLTDRNLQLENRGYDLVALAGSSAGLSLGGVCDLGSIERNYWGTDKSGTAFVDPGLGVGVSPFQNGLWDAGQFNVYAGGITYTASTANTRTTETGITGISCAGEFIQPERIEQADTLVTVEIDSCKHLHGFVSARPTTADGYRIQYDSLRRYIESCGKNDDSYDAFSAITAAVYSYDPSDSSRFETYRNWLISVLYLNTTQPYYFCACVAEMGATYRYSKINPTMAAISVLRFLRTIGACDDPGLEDEIRSDSLYAIQNGWGNNYPSLDSLGLGFLLNNAGAPVPSGSLSALYLSSMNAAPNPFNKMTDVTFTLNRMTYVTIAIYDELGRMYWGDGKGHSLDAGAHTIHIDGASLPSGTLYARISTGFEEVKTVKLVKN